jgi:hypothetical protein
MQAALAILIDQSTQTNQHLQKLTQELNILNGQLFNARPSSPVTPAPVAAAPIATVVPDRPIRKEIRRDICSEVGLTKTRSLSKWTVKFYIDGYYKVPGAFSRHGAAQLVQLVRGVLPQVGLDHFSEANFNQRNQEWKEAHPNDEGNYIEKITAPEPFIVEWYEWPGNDGRMYAYVERVYPTSRGETLGQ